MIWTIFLLSHCTFETHKNHSLQTEFGPYVDHGYIFPFVDCRAFVNKPNRERIFAVPKRLTSEPPTMPASGPKILTRVFFGSTKKGGSSNASQVARRWFNSPWEETKKLLGFRKKAKGIVVGQEADDHLSEDDLCWMDGINHALTELRVLVDLKEGMSQVAGEQCKSNHVSPHYCLISVALRMR